MDEMTERAKVYWFGLAEDESRKQFGEMGDLTPEFIAAMDTHRQPTKSLFKERPFSKSTLEFDPSGLRRDPCRGHSVDKVPIQALRAVAVV